MRVCVRRNADKGRVISNMKEKELFFSSIADDFDVLMNSYDLSRRLDIVFSELMIENINGKLLLDMGCGTGWFSKRAAEAGASVVSFDISRELVYKSRVKVISMPAVGNALHLPFSSASFDVVVSSEVIEHTVSPASSIIEMARVLKTNGTLLLTCPNKKWNWLVSLASLLRIRPYHGYENFPGYFELEECVKQAGLKIDAHKGFHPWPFQIRYLHSLSARVDRVFGCGIWGRFMINQAILAHKVSN